MTNDKIKEINDLIEKKYFTAAQRIAVECAKNETNDEIVKQFNILAFRAKRLANAEYCAIRTDYRTPR